MSESGQKRKLIWQPKSGKRHLFGAHSPLRAGGIRGPVSGYGVHHPLTHAASENRRMRDVISPTLSPWFKPRSGHDEPWWPRCAKLQTGSISSACPSTPQQVGRYPHGKDMAASAPSGDRETKLEYQLFEPMKKEANVGNRHHCR